MMTAGLQGPTATLKACAITNNKSYTYMSPVPPLFPGASWPGISTDSREAVGVVKKKEVKI